jgi:hypothetical protein
MGSGHFASALPFLQRYGFLSPSLLLQPTLTRC